MADGATTKDGCCDSFTAPHTWDTDKYHFGGSLNSSHREKLFQHSDAAKLQGLQPSSSASDWHQEDEPLFWCPPCRSAQSSGSQGSLVTTGMGTLCQGVPLRPGAAMPSTILKLMVFPVSWSNMPRPSLNRVFVYSARQNRSRSSISLEKAQPWSSRQTQLFCSNSLRGKALVHTRSSARKHTQLQKKKKLNPFFFPENTLFFTPDYFWII